MRSARALFLVFAITLAACSSSSSSTSQGASDAASAGLGDFDPTPFGGARPVSLYVPLSYSKDTPMPLLIMLHGYSASGLVEDLIVNFRPLAESRGFLYAHPDGTFDSRGKRFWNATDGCCNFDNQNVDDSTYIAGLVTEIATRYNVDKKRVFLFGHSNGGFMSYRLACDHADTFAAIVSLAGAMWMDKSKCNPSQPVSVLQIHGTADAEVAYDGTTAFPSAKTSVEDWAGFDGCATTADTSAPPIDIDDSLPGAETTTASYATGCKSGSAAQLFTIAGGQHVPGVNDNFRKAVIDFLFAHPKP